MTTGVHAEACTQMTIAAVSVKYVSEQVNGETPVIGPYTGTAPEIQRNRYGCTVT